ncbi:MAG: hypothetical protein COA49_00680 [Bacteroidetes bacterium]|nr:MAG: hypothetical protein COA49_00680 [Bacteroidota bacterium]
MKLIFTSTHRGWSEEFWDKWDAFLKHEPPSAYLDSRSIKAALSVPDRSIRAICWVDEESNIVGVASTEDTQAESISKGRFLKADNPFFKVAQQYLYRGDGVFRLNIRVLGMVLSSGDHAYRFSDKISQKDIHLAIDEALTVQESTKKTIPKTYLIKDHYTDMPMGERFAGKSNWHSRWVDLEFDPVMEIDLLPKWTTFELYREALRKKSRTKIRRILNSSSELVLKNLSFNEVDKLSTELYELYSKVFSRAGFKLGKLHIQDIVELKRHWGDKFPVIGYYHENTLVGFQCGIVTKDAVEAFFVGFNNSENRVHSIYQRMLLEFIQQGINVGAKKISLGRTALDIKSSLGACPKRLSCHMKVDNSVVHCLMRLVARASSPKIPPLKRVWKDDVIKDGASLSSRHI